MPKTANVVDIKDHEQEEDAKIDIDICELVKCDLDEYMSELTSREDVSTSEVMNEMAKWCAHWERMFAIGLVIAESAAAAQLQN
jgi:hypothetical protein